MTSQAMQTDRYLKFTLVYILTTIVADGIGLSLGAMFDPIVSIILFRLFNFDSLNFAKILCMAEWNIYWLDHFGIYACVLRFLGAQQSHCQTDQLLHVSVVDELFAGGARSVHIRSQS